MSACDIYIKLRELPKSIREELEGIIDDFPLTKEIDKYEVHSTEDWGD